MTLANTSEYCEMIRSEAVKNGLTVEQTHAPFQFKNWDSEEHFESVIIPRLARSLEMSARMEAKISVVHPIHYMVYKGHEEEIFQINMDFYRRLIPYCKEYGVKIAVENMWQRDKLRKCIVNDTCNTSAEFIRYVDNLDSEYVVACLDLGHVALCGREPQDAIRIIGDKLGALHVHDVDYRGDLHTLPGVSKINYDAVCKALADIDYKGDFTLEADNFLINYDKDFKPVALKFMADCAKHYVDKIEAYKAEK